MTKRRNTAPLTRTQTHADLQTELDTIETKLLMLVSHFRLADQRLWGDLDGLPEEYQPAAVVLHEATEALNALHNQLGMLDVRMADLFYKPGWRERLQAEMSIEADAVEDTSLREVDNPETAAA